MAYFTTGNSKAIPPLPTNENNFEINIAWWTAQCANLSYEKPATIASNLDTMGFSKVSIFDNGGTQAFIALHPQGGKGKGFAILAFRGTEADFKDILTDVNFLKNQTNDGKYKMHGGFWEGINKIWGVSGPPKMQGKIQVDIIGPEGVLSEMEKLPKGLPIYYTGHSLGGALATIAAYRRNPTALYTYGSPRVAGKELAKFINDPASNFHIYRFVNSTDIVPRVPPTGFGHVGHIKYLNRKGKLTSPTNMDDTFIKQLIKLPALFMPNSWAKKFKPRFFSNHSMLEYIRKIEGLLS